MRDRNINTIPTVRRHIVSYTILVEWSDSPRTVKLTNEMPNHVSNAVDEWFAEIEHEENVDES